MEQFLKDGIGTFGFQNATLVVYGIFLGCFTDSVGSHTDWGFWLERGSRLFLVFESPVRSGLFAFFWQDRDRDRRRPVLQNQNLKKTGPNRWGPVHVGLLRFFPVQDRS